MALNFLSSMFKGAAEGTIKGTLEGIGTLAKDIRSAITGELSPEKKAEILNKAIDIENMTNSGQIQINAVEAAHPKLFVAGWRPNLGWVCGISIGLYFIPQYLVAAVLWMKLCWSANQLVPYPIPEPAGLMELVGLMLGLGGMRLVEKIKGVQGVH